MNTTGRQPIATQAVTSLQYFASCHKLWDVQTIGSHQTCHLCGANISPQMMRRFFTLQPDSTGTLQLSVAGFGHLNDCPAPPKGAMWTCSDRQRDLILAMIEEGNTTIQAIDSMALENFGRPARSLSKQEACALIDLLLSPTA